MKIGQGLLLEVDYADGGVHNKPRTFLIIEVNDKNIHILNVSSLKGKETKLGYKSNKKIDKYKPPFLKSSFVKLDALYIIEKSEHLNHFLLAQGRSMNPMQLNNIKQNFINYREKMKIFVKNISIKDILDVNLPSYAESAMGKKD